MKLRYIKRAFHARFAVIYGEREIWTGTLVRHGRMNWNSSRGRAYGTHLYDGKAPTLP